MTADDRARSIPGISSDKNTIEKLEAELREGMELAKCRKCGCMQETLESLHSSLVPLQVRGSFALLDEVEAWLSQMEPVKYT